MRIRAATELARSPVRARLGRCAPRKRRRANHRFSARKNTEAATTRVTYAITIHRLQPRPAQTT